MECSKGREVVFATVVSLGRDRPVPELGLEHSDGISRVSIGGTAGTIARRGLDSRSSGGERLMCGIVGVVRAGGVEPADCDRVATAVEALRHRGPDGNGVHAEARCVLGHTRLSIVDLAGGAQPMRNEDGSILAVFNGEIWNHLELRRQLEQHGHRFATRCDTEVLVHGYEEWGDRLPSLLNGMFAFAVWDGRRERLLLARDRLGKKPLYVAELDGGLVVRLGCEVGSSRRRP